jgi:hypothetical protein
MQTRVVVAATRDNVYFSDECRTTHAGAHYYPNTWRTLYKRVFFINLLFVIGVFKIRQKSLFAYGTGIIEE